MKDPTTQRQNTHLSIYEHLPRDINVLADASKYQEWARRVIPRITSPALTCDDAQVQNEAQTPRHLLHETPQLHDHVPSLPDTVTSRSIDVVLRGRKVRPGLCRGSVSNALRVFKQESRLPKAPVQSPVHVIKDATVTSHLARAHKADKHPFYALAKRGPIINTDMATSLPAITSSSLLAPPTSRSRVPHAQRRYFAISRPALDSQSTSSFVLASLHDPLQPAPSPKPNRFPTTCLNKAPRASALSTGLRQGPSGRSIPSSLEMHQTRNFVVTARMTGAHSS